MAEMHFPYPHDADPEVFREALAYSEATTGFTVTLIEKDYYCSLVLQYFFASDTSLVFKGGTCLSKVHADFYRLSEDLDLIISVNVDSDRSERRAEIEPVKRMLGALPTVVPGMAISEAFRGHNVSRQYIGYLEYPSAILEKQERIRVEIGVREPLLDPPESKAARTIAVNPFSGLPLLTTFAVRAMALRETYAEKLRAATTRREPAIRDFFDLFYAVKEIGLDIHDSEFLSTAKAKLEVPGNAPVDLSEERKRELYQQLDAELKPVLRPVDFAKFNLDEAFQLVCSAAEAVSFL